MKNQKTILIMLATLIVITVGTAASIGQEGTVGDRAFDIMLKALLSHSVPELDVDEAAQWRSACFIDAREYREFEVSRIQGATWSGYDDFDISRLSGIGLEDTVIVYCSVGYRSEKIAEKLQAAGYEHVWNMYGGIFDWKNSGKEVVDSNGDPTENVHAFDKNWGRWLKSGVKVYNKP